MEIRKCGHCGKDISHLRADALYCCKSCTMAEYHKRRRKASGMREKQYCKRCGTDISDKGTRAIYCSDSCRQLEYFDRKKAKDADQEERTCTVCGNKFLIPKYKRSTTCSPKCRNRKGINNREDKMKKDIIPKDKKYYKKARKKNKKEILRIDADAKAHGMSYGQWVALHWKEGKEV